MAEKRMFSKSITDRDDFLSMPTSTQCLYFHLAMHADDDGFVDSPRRIQNSIGARDDDFKILLTKQYLIPFESGICVIRHWRMHNYLRADRYKPTAYQAEKSQLAVLQSGEYTTDSALGIPNGNQLDTNGMHRVVKSSIDKNRVAEVCGGFLSDSEADELSGKAEQLNAVFDAAERAGFPHTEADMNRLNQIVADYHPEPVLNAIDRAVDAGTTTRTWRYLLGILKSDPTGGTQGKVPKWEPPLPPSYEG